MRTLTDWIRCKAGRPRWWMGLYCPTCALTPQEHRR